jgi:hypothetical protein
MSRELDSAVNHGHQKCGSKYIAIRPTSDALAKKTNQGVILLPDLVSFTIGVSGLSAIFYPVAFRYPFALKKTRWRNHGSYGGSRTFRMVRAEARIAE